MNLLNKTLLRLAFLPEGLYRKMGVNTLQLRAILHTKLTLDDRRPNTLHQSGHKKKDKPITAATVGTFFMSLVVGTFLVAFFGVGNNFLLQATLYFFSFMFMLAASLISDFTSVLIDVRDNFIILPKPVNDRTFVLARILHIFIHLCKVVVPMSLPAFIFSMVEWGALRTVLFAGMAVMATLFTIFFINALYLLILKVTTPRKFQSLISYVQIFFAIVLYGSYHFTPRLAERLELGTTATALSPFRVAAPPYWFAAGWQVFYTLRGTAVEWTGAVLSIIIPLASLHVVIKYLAPAFNSKLALTSGGTENTSGTTRNVRKGGTFISLASRLMTQPGPERMGFLFTLKMSARSRDFRLKVYPLIGYMLMMAAGVGLQHRNVPFSEFSSGSDDMKTLLLSAVYISGFLVFGALEQAKFSERYKAAWLFYIAPVDRPGKIIRGSMKASIFRFFTPFAFLISVAALWLGGVGVVPNLFLGLMNQLLILSLIVYAGNRQLPFSLPEENARKAGGLLRTLFYLFVCGLTGIPHYFLYGNLPVIGILSLLSLVATWLVTTSIREMTWEQLATGNKQ